MVSTQNINNSFFNGVYKDVWRQLVPPGLTEAETDFIADAGSLASGAHIIDLMCGYGRHALALARQGYAVTAVDNQKEYIAEIKAAADTEGLSVSAVTGSALEYVPDGLFDAAICMGNSFAFFDAEQAEHLLRTLAAHIKSGGVFIINTWMLGEIAIRHFKEKEWFYAGDYKYIIDNEYLFQPSRIQSEHLIISPDGSTEAIAAVDYIFTLPELEHIFNKTGFALKSVFSTPRKRPFSVGDTRAYIVAARQ